MLGLLLLHVLASCLWLGHSEVVTSFNKCPQFFYAGSPPNDVLNPPNPAWICQWYNNSYVFATLYDRDRRIPVYSAYIYEPGHGNRSQSWFVEPQVKNVPWPRSNLRHVLSTAVTDSIYIEIFLLTDQKSSSLNELQPCQENLSSRTDFLTISLCMGLEEATSGVPENQTMAQKTKGCTITYVIVGAVPGSIYISNKRVNVPSHIWSAACCQTKTNMKAWAVIAENNKNQTQSLTLKELEDRLTTLYKGKTVTLFHSNCPRK
ncbi:ENDD1 protein, partial [Spelaeornis formosus]|nr:ENDD1 protein [Elachura formosa]